MTEPTQPDEPVELPEWFGPPEDETGAVVPLRVVVFQDAMTAITVTGLVAYSTGFSLTLNVLRRVDGILRLIESSLGHMHRSDQISDKVVRFEIEYADGRRASCLDGFDETPRNIRLTGGSGGGGDTSFRSHYWAWPLPPIGSVKLAVEWPSIDLSRTEIEIDAGPILDAAAQSLRLWQSRPLPRPSER